MAIIAAGSLDDAQNIADNEPVHKAGLGRNTVQGHMINEGVACYFARALSRRVEALGEPFDPDISMIDLSNDALAERAAGAHLYLISLEPTDKTRPAEDVQTGHDHFIWLRDNEMRAKLMSCGPAQSTQSPSPGFWGGGLGIVATSRAEAERIRDVEPSGQAGYRTLSVRAWTLDYGLATPIAKALETLNSLPR